MDIGITNVENYKVQVQQDLFKNKNIKYKF